MISRGTTAKERLEYRRKLVNKVTNLTRTYKENMYKRAFHDFDNPPSKTEEYLEQLVKNNGNNSVNVAEPIKKDDFQKEQYVHGSLDKPKPRGNRIRVAAPVQEKNIPNVYKDQREEAPSYMSNASNKLWSLLGYQDDRRKDTESKFKEDKDIVKSSTDVSELIPPKKSSLTKSDGDIVGFTHIQPDNVMKEYINDDVYRLTQQWGNSLGITEEKVNTILQSNKYGLPSKEVNPKMLSFLIYRELGEEVNKKNREEGKEVIPFSDYVKLKQEQVTKVKQDENVLKEKLKDDPNISKELEDKELLHLPTEEERINQIRQQQRKFLEESRRPPNILDMQRRINIMETDQERKNKNKGEDEDDKEPIIKKVDEKLDLKSLYSPNAHAFKYRDEYNDKFFVNEEDGSFKINLKGKGSQGIINPVNQKTIENSNAVIIDQFSDGKIAMQIWNNATSSYEDPFFINRNLHSKLKDILTKGTSIRLKNFINDHVPKYYNEDDDELVEEYQKFKNPLESGKRYNITIDKYINSSFNDKSNNATYEDDEIEIMPMSNDSNVDRTTIKSDDEKNIFISREYKDYPVIRDNKLIGNEFKVDRVEISYVNNEYRFVLVDTNEKIINIGTILKNTPSDNKIIEKFLNDTRNNESLLNVLYNKPVRRKLKIRDPDEMSKGGNVLIVDNYKDAFKQLSIIMGNLASGGKSEEIINNANRLIEYLYTNKKINKNEYKDYTKFVSKFR